jgi:hypothetical protein
MEPAPELATVETKLCSKCVERKPLTQFRRRIRGTELRHPQCKDCDAQYRREQSAAGRRKKLDDSLFQLRRYRESPGNLEWLANTVIKFFGSAIGYAEALAKGLKAAQDAGDHKTVQRYLMGIADFAFVAEFIATRRALNEKRRQFRAEQARQKKRRDERDDDYDDMLRMQWGR